VLVAAVAWTGCSADPGETSGETLEGPKLVAPEGGPALTSPARLPNLGERLADQVAQAREKLPVETMQSFQAGVEEVDATGIAQSALNVADQAIDAELPDTLGKQVQLSTLWQQGPVVLMWYRGGWCPYCNLQLRAMQEALPAIQEAGGALVAITPELPDHALTTSEKNGLEYVVLSDVGNQLARQYGLVFQLPASISPIYKQMFDLAQYNGDDSKELPLAATYVIDTAGVIRYAFLDADYTKRAEPAAVIEVLENL
jgi:peroxiredoxin